MKNKKILIFSAVIAVLVAALISAALIADSKNAADESSAVKESEKVTLPPAEDPQFRTVKVSDGLYITGLTAVNGNFVEDGSNAPVENVVAATVKNDTDKTLQFAKINVPYGGEIYTFDISTIPPKGYVMALESSKKSAPDEFYANVTATAEHEVYFPEAPSVMEDTFSIKVKNDAISVTNITGEPIDRDFSVYFKNQIDGTFVGGITYRVRFTDTLEPGKTLTGYASHAIPDESVIMFVQYDS